MKLKTKLIPLASIVTACAAITPLALTSCGSKEWVDLMEMYTPSFDKMEASSTAQPLSDKQAMEAWTESAEEYPERIAQENYWSEARNIQIINSRAFINNYDPDLMWSNVIYGGSGGTVPVSRKDFTYYGTNQGEAHYVFSDVSNRLRYTKYEEYMHDISITTQRLTVYSSTGAPTDFYIPTVSFTLEYNRTYESAYNGKVATPFANKAQVFYMQTERETSGTLVFENVPVWIADLEDRSGANCWTIVPFIQWGCEDPDITPNFPYSFDYYLKERCDGATLYDQTGAAEPTLYPRAWSITSKYHNKQVGNYLSDTNGFDVNFEADTTEQLTLEDMPIDMPNLYNMSTFGYIVEGGIFASWYIHNQPAMRKSMHLWNLDYFNGIWE